MTSLDILRPSPEHYDITGEVNGNPVSICVVPGIWVQFETVEDCLALVGQRPLGLGLNLSASWIVGFENFPGSAQAAVVINQSK